MSEARIAALEEQVKVLNTRILHVETAQVRDQLRQLNRRYAADEQSEK